MHHHAWGQPPPPAGRTEQPGVAAGTGGPLGVTRPWPHQGQAMPPTTAQGNQAGWTLPWHDGQAAQASAARLPKEKEAWAAKRGGDRRARSFDAAAEKEAPPMSCPSGHFCQLFEVTGGDASCSRCRKSIPSEMAVTGCKRCSHFVCQRCHPVLHCGRCGLGHAVFPTKAAKGPCDGCTKQITPGDTAVTCPDCHWSCCKSCRDERQRGLAADMKANCPHNGQWGALGDFLVDMRAKLHAFELSIATQASQEAAHFKEKAGRLRQKLPWPCWEEAAPREEEQVLDLGMPSREVHQVEARPQQHLQQRSPAATASGGPMRRLQRSDSEETDVDRAVAILEAASRTSRVQAPSPDISRQNFLTKPLASSGSVESHGEARRSRLDSTFATAGSAENTGGTRRSRFDSMLG